MTGLEPATPGVTGRYSNQLSYHRALPGQIDGQAGGVKRETAGNCLRPDVPINGPVSSRIPVSPTQRIDSRNLVNAPNASQKGRQKEDGRKTEGRRGFDR